MKINNEESMTTFTYGQCKIKDIRVETALTPKRKGKGNRAKTYVKAVYINEEPVKDSKRLWTSLQMRFRFNKNIFKYFSYSEVFERIAEVAPNSDIRYCIERPPEKEPIALALTNPNNAIVTFDDLAPMLEKYNAEDVIYNNGIVRSRHAPRVPWKFNIGGDEHLGRFVVDTPIDGFSKPLLYVSLLRTICSNGAIGYGDAFRSSLNVGKKDDNILFTLQRALEGFNNEEGYEAMEERFKSSTKSWASVYEAMKLHKTVLKLFNNHDLLGVKSLQIGNAADNVIDTSPVMQSLMKMTGNLNTEYGLSNIDTLSQKKQRTIPAYCKVYDVINFASEIATHHCTPQGSKVLQGFIGDLISTEYDLEGTGLVFKDPKDFFVGRPEANQTLQEMGA